VSAQSSPIVLRHFVHGKWSMPEMIGDVGDSDFYSAPTLVTGFEDPSVSRVPVLWPEAAVPIIHWWTMR